VWLIIHRLVKPKTKGFLSDKCGAVWIKRLVGIMCPSVETSLPMTVVQSI
jgi:hypothetical protein